MRTILILMIITLCGFCLNSMPLASPDGDSGSGQGEPIELQIKPDPSKRNRMPAKHPIASVIIANYNAGVLTIAVDATTEGEFILTVTTPTSTTTYHANAMTLCGGIAIGSHEHMRLELTIPGSGVYGAEL